MPNTAINGFPYPSLSAAPNVPQDIQSLAVSIDGKMPKGMVGYAVRTTQAGPVAAGGGYVNVAGLSVTVTIAQARNLELNFMGQATSDQAGTIVGIRLWNRTTSGGEEQTTQVPVANYGMPMPNYLVTQLPAGTYTFDCQLAQFGGPGSAYLTAKPSKLVIKDLGPA